MINGQVAAELDSLVTIEIRNGQGGLQAVEVVVDTGCFPCIWLIRWRSGVETRVRWSEAITRCWPSPPALATC